MDLQLETNNSQVDFYVELCVRLIADNPLGTESRSKHLRRDQQTVRSRTAAEGLSFLTKALPSLGKALDLGLEQGRLSIPQTFARAHGARGIPAFLQEYFRRIFREDGAIREDACPACIKHVRQVTFVAYKLEVPYSETANQRVLDAFVETEEELQSLELGTDDTQRTLRIAEAVVSQLFKGFDPSDILPRHGPGAVATGEKLDAKWVFARKYEAIHRVFPYYTYMVSGRDELVDRLRWYKNLEVHESGTAKVVLVPKDSRGPRLISCEPLEYQWLQQGLGRAIMAWLEKSSLSAGHINFASQTVNAELARRSSATREFATLDLKDASDRVSVAVVEAVFRSCPRLLVALKALRTTATVLPSGETVQLSKYAPMGSALCFPVEATVFWAVLVAAAVRETGLPLRRVVSKVYVYGDDIIVPTEWAEFSIRALQSVGLKVNVNKSYVQGHFRESCGTDAYKGVVVTPHRMRKPWSGRNSDGAAYAAYVSLANSLAKDGYLQSSDYVWASLEKVYGKIPYGTETSPYPCRIVADPKVAESRLRRFFRTRWNQHLQRLEFRLRGLVSRKIDSTLDDWPRLLRGIVMPQMGDPSVVVVPRSTKIKLGWTPV